MRYLKIRFRHTQNDALFLNNLGSIQLELKELENAKTSYQKAIDAQPDYQKAHNNLGVVLYELGQFEKASVSYEKALVLDPVNMLMPIII